MSFFSVKICFLNPDALYFRYRENTKQEMNQMNEDFLKLMETRRTCRNFNSQPVPPDVLDRILRAGTFAATGRNRQSPIMIAVTDPELLKRLSRLNAEIMDSPGIDPFYGAGTVIIVLADREIPTYLYDGTLVMGNLMLAAHACGVDSCWVHRAKEEFERPEGKAILERLGISGSYEGIGHCALGYAAAPLNPASPRKENYIYRIGPSKH